ncbi:MAG: hypothetical protein ACK4P3_09480 [Fimbriimonadaceae bacterium]
MVRKPEPLLPGEAEILEDIKNRTGVNVPSISFLNRLDKVRAAVLLPIIKEWIARCEHFPLRTFLYRCFGTPHAREYLDDLLAWHEIEPLGRSLSEINQALALIVTDENAKKVWEAMKRRPPTPEHYVLLAKLAKLPSTEVEVREHLVKSLYENPRLETHDLRYLSSVDDRRITDWFETKIDSPNAELRILAKRIVARRKKQPPDLRESLSAPNRSKELFSTEVDIDDLKGLLPRLSMQFGLRLNSSITSGNFAYGASLDTWLVTVTLSERGEALALWFRLEDEQTIEIVLTESPEGTGRVA